MGYKHIRNLTREELIINRDSAIGMSNLEFYLGKFMFFKNLELSCYIKAAALVPTLVGNYYDLVLRRTNVSSQQQNPDRNV